MTETELRRAIDGWYVVSPGGNVALTAWVASVSACLFLALALLLLLDLWREDKACQDLRGLVGWMAALCGLTGLVGISDIAGVWGQLLWLGGAIRLVRVTTVGAAIVAILIRYRRLGRIVNSARQQQDEEVIYEILRRLRAQARHHAAQ